MKVQMFIDTVPYVSALDAKRVIEAGTEEFPEFENMTQEERFNEIKDVFSVPGTIAVTMRSASKRGPLVGLAVISVDQDWNVGLCSSIVLNTVVTAYREAAPTFQREVMKTLVRHAKVNGAKWVAWSHRDKRSTQDTVKYTNTYRPLRLMEKAFTEEGR